MTNIYFNVIFCSAENSSGSENLLSTLNGFNNSAALWARAQTLIMEEKQKQMKLSQQQQQISPKSISVVQLGAKRTVSQKDEDVRQFESLFEGCKRDWE